MTKRDFNHLEKDLEQTVTKLKETKDSRLRRDLLLELRKLLAEADGLLVETSD